MDDLGELKEHADKVRQAIVEARDNSRDEHRWNQELEIFDRGTRALATVLTILTGSQG